MMDEPAAIARELLGRAEEVRALEQAGVIEPSWAADRLALIAAAQSLLLAEVRRRWAVAVRDRNEAALNHGRVIR